MCSTQGAQSAWQAGWLTGHESPRDSLAVSFVQPNSFSIIYYGIFMARAFVSRNYAFIIQNAFYATQTNGTSKRTMDRRLLCRTVNVVSV